MFNIDCLLRENADFPQWQQKPERRQFSSQWIIKFTELYLLTAFVKRECLFFPHYVSVNCTRCMSCKGFVFRVNQIHCMVQFSSAWKWTTKIGVLRRDEQRHFEHVSGLKQGARSTLNDRTMKPLKTNSVVLFSILRVRTLDPLKQAECVRLQRSSCG